MWDEWCEMSGVRWMVWDERCGTRCWSDMSGVRCVAWDEWREMTGVWDGWCDGVRWRRWVVYDDGRWVARAEWWEMSGGKWVVRDEWWEMSVYVTCCMRWVRWVVWDVCVCDMLCERWMRWVVWDGGERWAMWDEWIKMMSGVRWVVWERLPRTTFTHSKAPNPHARKTSTPKFRISYWHSYPERRLHTASCQTRTPGRHHRKFFASSIGTATPNTVYTQQGAKPACQEDITAIFSHLLLAGLPRTTFTHSKLIYTQQAAKPACQQHINTKFPHLLLAQLPRTEFTHSKAPHPLSTWPFLEALSTAPGTQTGAAGQRRAATLSRISEYCACHTDRSRGPAATRRAATLSRGTAPATQTCGPASSGDQARRNPF